MSRISLVFRLDDYSAISDSEFENKLLSLMDKYNVPCTFGVVPFVYEDEWDPSPQVEHPLTQEKIDLIKPFVEKGLVEVALHGYHHHTQKIRLNGHIPGEFYGIPIEQQFNMIKRGKGFLEDAFSYDVTTFIPPWNTYDENTLIALEQNGFRCISTGPRFGPVSQGEKLAYIPALCKLSKTKDVLEELQLLNESSASVVVWFHQYELAEIYPTKTNDHLTFGFLESLFFWITQNQNITIKTLAQAVTGDKIYHKRRYQLVTKLRKNTSITPPFLKTLQELPDYYPQHEYLLRKLLLWGISLILFYLLLFLISFVIFYFLNSLVPDPFLSLFGAISGVTVIWTSIYLSKKRKIYYRSLSIFILLIGLLTSIISVKLFN